MVKYKINLKFKDTSSSLNELIIKTLKIELQRKLNSPYNYKKNELLSESINHSYIEESSNQ